jgi:phosphatidylglycerophosphate synthase
VSGSIVTPELRARVRGLAQPIARAFGRLGLSPNQLTLIGFGIAIVAGVAAARQAWLAAGVLVILGGVFDLFDGALARFAGKVSKLGAFYDSVFDRWGEGVVYVGIAWGCVEAGFGEGAVLAAAALTSAVMVSYARAKSESLGFTKGTGMASIGLAPREVRLAILTIGLIAVGAAGGVWPGTCPTIPADSLADCWVAPGPRYGGGIMIATLGLITILATITTIQRILHVRAQAREG